MKNWSRYLWGLFLLLTLLVGLTAPAAAQGSDPTDDDVNAIASQLYCPVCENIPLDACGTAACEQWRGIIREKLAAGWSEDQIKDYFVAQYGDRVLAEPPRRGFNWLVYVVPVVVLLAGAVLLVLGFQKWRSPDSNGGGKGAPTRSGQDSGPEEEYLKKVEAELQARSRSAK